MWKEVDTLIYYIHKDYKFYSNVVIFSLIGTIIRSVSCKYDNIKLNYLYSKKTIIEKLKELSDNCVSIIIYECFNTNILDIFKKVIEQIMIDINVPIITFFSTKRNKYSKPFTHIWKLIELMYKKDNNPLYIDKSLMIGNKAGRISHKHKKLDKSSLDRAFASNIKISFTTPERFFLNTNKFTLWKYDNNLLNKSEIDILIKNANNINTPIIIDEINILPIFKTYTIIVTGPPTCGKTILSHKIKKKWDTDYNKGNIDIIDITSTEENKEEDIKLSMGNSFVKSNSVLIHLTYNKSTILNIIKYSINMNSPVLVIEIMADIKLCKLLNFSKVQKSETTKTTLLNELEWSLYYKSYTKINYKNMICVRHVEFPLLLNITDEIMYDYSY